MRCARRPNDFILRFSVSLEDHTPTQWQTTVWKNAPTWMSLLRVTEKSLSRNSSITLPVIRTYQVLFIDNRNTNWRVIQHFTKNSLLPPPIYLDQRIICSAVPLMP